MNIVIMIFIASLFFSCLSMGLQFKESYMTIYVDDDNIDGPWYGTVGNPYRYVQDAIDNSSHGDTIRVYSGIYDNPDNNVLITKTLSVIGNGSDVTFIKRSVSISADDVFFSGFTLHGFDYKTLKKTFCIRLENSNSCNINNNTLATGLCGIEFYDSHYNKIKNNIIEEREIDKPGIYLLSSTRNMIQSNQIDTNDLGVYLDQSENNIIDDNNITNCSYPIYLFLSNNTEIKNNMIGIAEDGISIFSSNNNVISGNNINTREDGIYGSSSNYNLIVDNNISPKGGSRFGTGITLLWGCHFNTIENNNLSDVGYAGLTIGGNDNTIMDNDINSNNELGIYLYSYCHNNTITGNNISNNEYGIHSWSVLNLNNTISSNVISNNKQEGILLIGADNTISDNVISNNGDYGIRIRRENNLISDNIISNNSDGIILSYFSRGCTIAGNLISSNDHHGIMFERNCYGNLVIGNTIIYNKFNGVKVESECYNNTIFDNNISYNNKDGIHLCESNSSTIADNIILNNCYGIRLTNSSKNNNIFKNTIGNSSEFGIYLDYSFFNRIKKNNMRNNNHSAYFENASFNLWFRNYWDDWSSIRPKPIEGVRYWIFLKKCTPWINFDWRPAQEHYNI